MQLPSSCLTVINYTLSPIINKLSLKRSGRLRQYVIVNFLHHPVTKNKTFTQQYKSPAKAENIEHKFFKDKNLPAFHLTIHFVPFMKHVVPELQ
jgi:hypothetical protein